MRRLLVDAQTKFRKMMEENKKLAARIDGSIQSANQDMSVLRAELEDTNKRITELSSDSENNREDTYKIQQHELIKLREKNTQLEREKKKLLKQLDELRYLDQMPMEIPSAGELKIQLTQTEHELARAKEALTAMKNDRKKLKTDKVELLQQMKQLYSALEAKDEELRDFIRNYEYQVEESDNSMRQLVLEKEEAEKNRWEILKRARDEAERCVLLREQMEHKNKYLSRLEDELREAKRQLELERSERYSSTPRELQGVATRGTPHSTAGTTPGAITTRDISCISGTMSPSSEAPIGELHFSNFESPAIVHPPASLAHIVSPPHTARSHLSQSGISDITDDGQDSIHTAPECDTSKSTEDLDVVDSSGTHEDKKKRKKKKSGAFGSLSKVFGRGKNKKILEALVYEDTPTASMEQRDSSLDLSQDDKLLLVEECKQTAMIKWSSSMVSSWLECTMHMPKYTKMCATNIKSGKVLLGLTDAELDVALGINNTLHHRKLRLAIEEEREDVESKYPKAGEMDHEWVARNWLNDLGLGQHSLMFEEQLVDGRVLNVLSKKDLDKHLNVTRKFHQASLLHGIELLRRLNFDKEILMERRASCEEIDVDPLVWTNHRVIKWAKSIDLKEYADNLLDSGVHGALLVLEPSFNSDAMAAALGIPSTKNIIRRHLQTELNGLITPARGVLEATGMSLLGNKKKGSSGSVGKSFVRSYKGGYQDEEKKRYSFRGSLGRVLGRRARFELERNMFEATPEEAKMKRSKSQELTESSNV
ncbi:kazrin-like [Saccoglossus kowalevskii]|uniref:Kazrin-like n=1 Tax=Saccoglossus kowalevskii TaxID=10224 RepID=A0ABM0MI76_SACKO|nr:PREDICTED: kazrin-like [Saccoglossus kowalevskii]